MAEAAVVLGLTVLTVVLVTVIGLFVSRGRVRSVEDYIAARDSIGSGTLSASVVASMMGAWILFSPAEAGAVFGGIPAILGYAVGSAIPLLLFIPIGRRIRTLIPAGHSLTEYAYARFGPRMYGFVLVVSVFYMFMFLAAEMTGIAGALAFVAGIPRWQTSLLIGGFVLAYTVYGGLVASIVTDTLQTLVILPVLAIGFAGAVLALGGTGTVHETTTTTDPTLLDPAFGPGVAFGVYIAIAIVGANMLNQGMWQRVYAADGSPSLRRGFGVAALLVIPMVALAGLFGIAAAGFGLVDEAAPSLALFLVMDMVAPDWITLLVVLLAVLLVMSSADTMFNAIASVITADLARIVDTPDQRMLWIAGRVVTIAVALGAIAIGSRGYSVLELFLLADLVAAAVVVPFLAGMYTDRLSGSGALISSMAGVVVGIVYFPLIRGLLSEIPGLAGLLPGASFLVAFGGALAVSTALTVLATATGSAGVDLGSLDRKIKSLDEPVRGGRAETPDIDRWGER